MYLSSQEAFERIPLCTYVLMRGDSLGTLNVRPPQRRGPSPKWIPELGICGHCQLEQHDNCSLVPKLVCNQQTMTVSPPCDPQCFQPTPKPVIHHQEVVSCSDDQDEEDNQDKILSLVARPKRKLTMETVCKQLTGFDQPVCYEKPVPRQNLVSTQF